MRYDVAVIGLGAMGSASLAHCAMRGVRAIGIDRYARGHANGSSSGESRIIRKAYFENPAYVPLLERAYPLWHDLQAKTNAPIIDLVGILLVGAPERQGIAGTLKSAHEYGLPLDTFDAEQIARHFPGTCPRRGEIGLLERDAGMLFPEPAMQAHLDLAERHGAEIRFDARVASWERRGGVHHLVIEDHGTVEAARVVLTAGMWTAELLPGLSLPLRVQRNVQVWFEPSTAEFDRGVFPTFFVERLELPAPLYGFPAFEGTLKAAFHKYGDPAEPEHLERRIRDSDVTVVRDALEEWMPGSATAYARGKVCPYTLTPDENFIIDRHPDDPSVIIACGFSGHGFKFSPVVGEITADLAIEDATQFDIDFLRLGRFETQTIAD